jgi:hypothetical protein
MSKIKCFQGTSLQNEFELKISQGTEESQSIKEVITEKANKIIDKVNRLREELELPLLDKLKINKDEQRANNELGKSNGDRRGWNPSRGNQTLEGAPIIKTRKNVTGADPELTYWAEEYARRNEIGYKRQSKYVEVNEERAERIAQAYEEMQHEPQNPIVKEAFENLISQTKAQYYILVEAGYRFYFFDETNDPYNGSPYGAMEELRNEKRMGSFATEAGFGSAATELNVEDNPMLADTGIEWGYGSVNGKKKRVLANDLFRAVHDAFGHGLEGAGFRARGEENAWQAHARLFTGSAVAAITSETRGQNSWLNFGKYAEQNRTAKVEDTIFADQKTGLMPEWTWTEGFDNGEVQEDVNSTQEGEIVADKTLFEKMQEFKRMPEMKIEGNSLTTVNENDSRVQLEQTLKLSDDLSISSDIIYLNELSQDLYDENIEDVKQLIKEIEVKAAKQGVDIAGLSDKLFSKSRDEIYDLLESLNTLLLEPSEQSFNDFIGQHQSVFETEAKPVTKVEAVSENNKNKSLIYLKTKLSEYELFNDFGLLKASENIYQRVEKEDLEILYNKLYDISQYNENILPLEAFPIANNDGAINLETLRNIENRELIVADIKRFIENEVSKLDVPSVSLDNTTLQQLVINKYAFEHPLNFTQTVDVQEEFNSFEAFDGNEEYLKTDFISDFYSDYLQEKIKNSEKYREFYSNFSINEGGVVLVNDDAITTQKIKDYLAEKNIKKGKNLENYSLLTDQIPNLKTTERNTSDYTRDFYRTNYSNNPMTLEKVKGDYKFLTDTTILKNNSVENFIRVKDRVFELVDTKGGNSFYEEIPVNISEYKVFSLSQPVLSVNIDNYGAERLDEAQAVKAEKYYSKAEEQKINEESFECL